MEIQGEVMTFADRFWAVVSESMDDVRNEARTPQRRLDAQSFKIVAVESALRIATDANPVVAVLDMTVMVTLMRQVWDEYWGPEVYHEPPGGPVSTAFASLQNEIWTIAERLLDPEEIEALYALIHDMREAYPDMVQVYVVNLRASEFASDRQHTRSRVSGGPSLLRLFALDPLSSLTPAVRELQSSRLLAERAFFYATRLPGLVSWRTDRAVLFAAAMPEAAEARQALADLRDTGDRIGTLAESIVPDLERQRVEAIDQLFKRVSAERASTIDQAFGRLTAERQAIVSALRDDQGDVRALLGTFDETARATTALSDSLRETFDAAQHLTKAVGDLRGEGGGGGNARPFDIREYHAVTESATQTVRELSALVVSLHTLLEAPGWAERDSQISAAVDRASTASAGLINRTFALAFGLVAFTLFGVFLTTIGCRAVTARMNRRGSV